MSKDIQDTHEASRAHTKKEIDPICGMSVDPTSAAGQYDYKGATYYFCAMSCLERFRVDPERALSKKPVNLVTMPSSRRPLPMMQPAEHAEIDPVCGPIRVSREDLLFLCAVLSRAIPCTSRRGAQQKEAVAGDGAGSAGQDRSGLRDDGATCHSCRVIRISRGTVLLLCHAVLRKIS